jgi:YD repeat-containing protein
MNYKIAILKLLLIVFLLPAKSTNAQQEATFDKLVDFLPPAPNAAAITRYGEASVNKNTGTPNISIPLFGVKGTKLSTNINLGYSSNGIKVDEIASRVGMGWAINAGGVITRTLRGVPDESNSRHYPYAQIGFNWATYNYMRRIARSQQYNGYSGGHDAEPDIFNFSFDGYSGSFVFTGNGIALVNKSGLKVETDFQNAAWTFKIITNDGTKYFFGGNNATEKTKRDQSCGKTYSIFLATAWYLKEIQHLNGEKIIFNYTPHTYKYDNGVSQTLLNPGLAGLVSGCACPAVTQPICVNITKTNGVLLTSIESPNKMLVSFDYITRQDCEDKLITKLTLKDPVNTITSFDFNYNTVTSSSQFNNEYYLGNDKTPYLISIVENSSDNLIHKTHYFSYIEPEGRPARLSFSQDHWGYFNGKINTSFVPLDTYEAKYFPSATANRDAEFAYAKKGLLQKIVYPTGGTTTLFYEPNSSDNGVNNTYTTPHKLSCDATGTGGWVQQIKQLNFHSDINQPVSIEIQCRDNSGTGNFDPLHNKGRVEITDATGSTIFFNEVYGPGFNGVINTYLPQPNFDYKLRITSYGSVVTTLATLKYKPNSNNSISSNIIAGGVRVQKIATANNTDAPLVKKYYYGTLTNLNQSSMAYQAKPVYAALKKIVQPCGLPSGGGFVCDYMTINSSSIFNLGYYNNSIVSYHSVVEGIGENFEGGATESKFLVNTDPLGQILWGNDIINSPFSNFSSFYNGKLHSETVVKKQPGGNLLPIKKTEYTYINEPAGENTTYGYSVVEKVSDGGTIFDTLCVPVYDPDVLSCYGLLNRGIGRYDMVRYDVFSSFVHPDTETQTLWDENGNNPVVSIKKMYFENLQHYQLTKEEVTNSKQQLQRTTTKYPHDYSSTPVYGSMIGNNITAVPVNIKTEIINTSEPNVQIGEQQIDYDNVGNNNYAPVTVKKAVKGNMLQTEGTIDQYDAAGNILQFTNKFGVITSFIWGYNYQYPVAQVVGVSYAGAIAQLTVGMTALQSMDGAALLTELNKIRINLPQARVTTYTYKHITGVTSITDPNNKINTYQYDAFNRLTVIKDQDGNAVKKNEYVYTTPDPNSGLTIFLNQPIQQTFICNTCQPGFTGSSKDYVIPQGKHYSLISQADADAKAQTDLVTNGQEYANKNGVCSNSANCTLPGYKFVSCGCERGQTITEYCVPSLYNPGTWFVYQHYLWSDGSVSPSFSTHISNCTGEDKKFINCACESGNKICDGVVNNGGGSYTTTYHYQWSDGSISPQYTTTTTCTGTDKKMINCNCETGYKVYVSSVQATKFNGTGCVPGQWLCTFYYQWSDGSTSLPNYYTECSPTNCMMIEY